MSKTSASNQRGKRTLNVGHDLPAERVESASSKYIARSLECMTSVRNAPIAA